MPEVTGWLLDAINTGQAIKKQQPTLEDEVTVEVVGQPGANKQQLYYLAMSTAFGIVRQYQSINAILAFVTPSYGMLMSEDDAADNWVRCTVRYSVGMWGAVTQNTKNQLMGTTTGSIFDQLTVYRGPQCNVNGGKFDFLSTPLPTAPTGLAGIINRALDIPGFLGQIPGIPANPNNGDAPELPFAGQPILTTCPTVTTPNPTRVIESPAPTYPIINPGPPIPSPNPKPPGDNRSRGAIPVSSSSTSQSGINTQLSTSNQQSGLPNTIISDGVGAANQGSTVTSNCCNVNLAIIPLVFAALSAPATNSDMTFPLPVQGPPPNG